MINIKIDPQARKQIAQLEKQNKQLENKLNNLIKKRSNERALAKASKEYRVRLEKACKDLIEVLEEEYWDEFPL